MCIPCVTALPAAASVAAQTSTALEPGMKECSITTPMYTDVWSPGATYEIAWLWESASDSKSKTALHISEMGYNATAVLEKLNSDNSWERVVSQPGVGVNPVSGSSFEEVRMSIVRDQEWRSPMTVKIVLMTDSYPIQRLCSSDEFTVRHLMKCVIIHCRCPLTSSAPFLTGRATWW